MNTGIFRVLCLARCAAALSTSLLCTSLFAQSLPAGSAMSVSRVDQSMAPMSGTQVQIF